MIAKVNMYVYLKFGKNWTANMGDIAKGLSLILLALVFVLQFEPITVRGTGLKFCTQVGFEDSTCSNLSKCL